MAQYQNLPVFKDAYDLLIKVISVSRVLPREFRFTICEDLKKILMTIILGIYRANRQSSRSDELSKCRENIEAVKIYLRILHDLKQLSLKQYVMISERCEAVSKQLAAWEKYLKKNEKDANKE